MKKERNSNIELLRIVAMIAIVSGHLISQGGDISYLSTRIISIFLGSAARIAVNIFLFIGVYYMVDSDFKIERVLNLWGQLFLYTSCFTLIAILFKWHISVKDIIKGFLPFSTRALWFISAYLILIVLHPFLKYVFLLEKKKVVLLISILTYVLCVMPTFSQKQNDFIVNIAWFIWAYIFVGCLKKYPELLGKVRQGLKKFGLLVACVIYCVLAFCIIADLLYDNKFIHIIFKLSKQYLSDIKSIPNVLCAFSCFYYVISKKANEIKWINKLAKPVLAVYIIHQTLAFFPVLWSKIVMTELWFKLNAPVFVLCLMISIVVIYSFCGLLDLLRIRYIEAFYQRTKIYQTIIRYYKKTFGNIFRQIKIQNN